MSVWMHVLFKHESNVQRLESAQRELKYVGSYSVNTHPALLSHVPYVHLSVDVQFSPLPLAVHVPVTPPVLVHV